MSHAAVRPVRSFALATLLPLGTALALALAGCASQTTEDSSDSAPVIRSPAVTAALHHDESGPLTLLPVAERSGRLIEHEVKKLPRRGTGTSASTHDPVLQSVAPALLMPTASANFLGIGNGLSGFTVTSAPPDTNGDVGPNHYVQTVNSDFAVFNKSTGAVIYGPVALNTVWSGFGGGCQTNNDGDPVVLYDPIADRWIISQFSVSTTPYLQCVAVSTTPDPTGSYFRYSFTYTDFPDYPKMGVWPDAYYTSFNMFAGGTTFSGGKICAYDRAKMLLGQAATQQCFDVGTSYGGILPADLDGARLPPAGAPNPILALGITNASGAGSTLASWKFHVDWTTSANSTLTGPTALTVASYTEACGSSGTCVPQTGTTNQLDSLSDRLMFRLAYRNFGDHEALVVNHSITAGAAVGVRWYELRIDGSRNLSLFQQGTYAPDAAYRWMGSMAMDRSGNMALGFSTSSSTTTPSIRYTGRLVGDAAGQMTQGEGILITGSGSQNGTLHRWGDYSMMGVDPVDDCTFWFTTEYIPANGTFNWATRIGSFKFPGCGATASNDFSISASPAAISVAQNASGTSTISTATISGAAQTVSLAVTGVPAGATASLSPTSVTSGSASTLTVNAGTAAAGPYTLTITGTATSGSHATTVALTVTAPTANNFSIAASPTALTLAQGASGTSAISTATTSGSAQTVSLSVAGVPSGATASLSPTSVTSGGGSTLTVNAGTAAAGAYTLTVSGTAASGTKTVTVGLTVTAPTGGGGLTNGGFESGSFSGWTVVAGTAAVTTGSTHGGTYAAQLGATTPTSGDSTISQTFTTPAAGGTLSFWYRIVCPDTVAYDWATATLTDNAAATTTTLLAKVCTNTSAWSQVAAAVAGGKSYTLTLTSHDDAYATDPTYTYFDDVAITAPVAGGITNGGFESGGLGGWTVVGSAIASTTAVHGGTTSARVGSTSPTNGDSSIAQTFTVPSGSTSLRFWYRLTCPDTITYDWATATLRDNATGTTTTVLAKTCTNTGTWTQVSAAVTAGKSYTLTLISHDDNYATDPTFTYFDDVTLQ